MGKIDFKELLNSRQRKSSGGSSFKRSPSRGRSKNQRESGIINRDSNLWFFLSAIGLLVLTPVSIFLGMLYALVFFTRATAKVDDYIDENRIEDIQEFRVKLIRFLDGFTAVLFPGRKRFMPSTCYTPKPKRFKAIFGMGLNTTKSFNDPDSPYLSLSWGWKPRRLSFWMSLSVGTVLASFMTLLVFLVVDASAGYTISMYTSILYIQIPGALLAGFLGASAVAEGLRWGNQEHELLDTLEVPSGEAQAKGYVCSGVGADALKSLVVSHVKSEDDEENKFPAPDGLHKSKVWIPAFLSAFILSAAYYYGSLTIAPELILLVVPVFISGFILGGSKPFSKKFREGLLKDFLRRKEEKHKWDTILTKILPNNANVLPAWISTDAIPSTHGHDLYVSKFLIDNADLTEFFGIGERIAGAMDNTAGAIVEGAEVDGGMLKLSRSGSCKYMLIYHTPSADLGKVINDPHLKHWESDTHGKQNTSASAEGLFALRLAFSAGVKYSGMPDLFVASAYQHHVVDGSLSNVVWEVNCEFRKNTMSSVELQNRVEKLQEALRCKQLRVVNSSVSGQVKFIMSSCFPEEAELKDEYGMEKGHPSENLVNIPGGAPTDQASASRLMLIQAEWKYLFSKCLKNKMPSGIEVLEQQYWEDPGGQRLIGEIVINSIPEANFTKDLRQYLGATVLYYKPDSLRQITHISWGKGIAPDAYLDCDEPLEIRKMTLIYSMLEFWRAEDVKKNTGIDIADVRFHQLGDTEIMEVVCKRGTSDAFDNYKISAIGRSRGNLKAEWLRIGQTFSETETPDSLTFSIVFSTAPAPMGDVDNDTPMGRWSYALDAVWAYAKKNQRSFDMVMNEYKSLTLEHSLVQSRWKLPPEMFFQDFTDLTGQIISTHGDTVILPGVIDMDKSHVYLVTGEAIPDDLSQWHSQEDSEQVSRWNWEKMMVECDIRSQNKMVPTLAEVQKEGKTTIHVIKLPPGMGVDEIEKKKQKILATGHYLYLEIKRKESRALVITSHGDPLPKDVVLQGLYPRPSNWDRIPIGVGLHRQEKEIPGYGEFTIAWDLIAAPHMLVTGTTGSGKTSAMKVIASEAVARGYDLRLIDTSKFGADFAGIYEYPKLCKYFATELDTARDVIALSHEEMNKRLRTNDKYKSGNWYQLPKRIRPRPIMIMIDEAFAMLEKEKTDSDAGKERNQLKTEMQEMLSAIARKGRSAGVHMVLVAQRPDANVIQGEMKNNLKARLLLGNADATAREMMFSGHSSGIKIEEGLMAKGRGQYFQEGGSVDLVQTFWAGSKQEVEDNLRQMVEIVYGPNADLGTPR